MRPTLVVALLIAVAVVPASAEQRIAQYGAPYCGNLRDLRVLIAAMLHHDEASAGGLDCTFLKSGVRLEVLQSFAELAPGNRIVQVRVHGHGATDDGYTLSGDIEDAP